MEYLKYLNPEQREAVEHKEGPLLILAGAGSGKTRVLTSRMAHLISNGVAPGDILGVTFTNKAAGEMRDRVYRALKSRNSALKYFSFEDLWLTTFHSACLRILRMDIERLGFKKTFTVYDSQDQLVLIKECLKDLDINDKQVNPKRIREAISLAKDYLQAPAELKEKASDYYEDCVANVYSLYQEKLKELNGLDFGDLIFKTVELFQRYSDILKKYTDKFQYIQVDEYQDTNHAQYRFLLLLAQARGNIAVVGDPDQAIYQWRGADVNNILNFEKDFPGATVIKLEQNYRSTNNILNAANHLIKSNSARKHKDLWGEQGDGDLLELIECFDEKDEASKVIEKILYMRQSGVRANEIVIFYRVHAQSRIFEDVLRRNNMPYKIIGGVKFYERKEIKDLIAYLRLIHSPSDNLSFKRIVNVPARGVGKKALAVLEKTAFDQKCPLLTAIDNIGKTAGMTDRAKKSLQYFKKEITILRGKLATLKVSQVLDEIIEKTGYLQALQMEGTLEAKSRIENIKEFYSVVYEFEENDQGEGALSLLESFLESISLQTDIDNWDSEEESLTLMTVHAAKGLEFNTVFLVGLEEDIFPHASAIEEGVTGVEEERRLCYVGITRAKKKVYLSFASRRRLYGYITDYIPSRFIGELPSAVLDITQPDVRYEMESDYL